MFSNALHSRAFLMILVDDNPTCFIDTILHVAGNMTSFRYWTLI